MDLVRREGRTFFNIWTGTQSLRLHTLCVTVWGHYSFGLLSTRFHCPSLNPWRKPLTLGDPRGTFSPWAHTHPLLQNWNTSPWLGLSDHSSHGVKESRFASSLRQVVRHLAQWIPLLLGLAKLGRWQSRCCRPVILLITCCLQNDKQRNRQSRKSPAEIIWVPGCSHAWHQMHLWKP